MSRPKGSKRLELGEEEWKEREKERCRKKAKRYYYEKGRYATAWRIRVKQKLIEYKGNQCQRCGYDKKIPAVYDFHHRDPKKKDFGIGSYKVLNFEKLKKEADKCDLLCRNCHAEIHDEWNKKQREELLKQHEQWQESRLAEIQCSRCKVLFKPISAKRKYCSVECYRKTEQDKRPNRPSKKELSQDVSVMTWVAMGKKFGVTDNAVRKWAKKYELI